MPQGRSANGSNAITYLASPTPGNANKFGPGLPTVAFTRTGGNVIFTLGVLPNFSYRLAFKDDFSINTWTPLGQPVTATGTTLVFIDDTASGQQRFYRVVRIP